MSCNAFGHAPDCKCGWGGVFYANGHHTFADKKSRFLSPNSKCPQCSAPVYFYRNNDSAVYFDEMGPPLPKHACFIEHQIKKEQAKSDVADSGQWIPLRIFWLQQGYERISLIGTSSSSHALLSGGIKNLDVNAPWFYKFLSIKDQHFKLSTLVRNKIGDLYPVERDGWGVGGLLHPDMMNKYPKTYAIYFDENRNRRK